jgi:hypothetical protein
MMKEAVFDASNEALIEEAIQRFAEKGYQVACTSNAGLRPGLVRITWLPDSAFKETSDGENK